MLEFKFSNALLHYPKSDAPSGFFWKYGLCYVLVGIVLTGISLLIMRPIIEIYIEMFAMLETDGTAPDEAAINALFLQRMDEFTQSSLLMFVVLLPLSLVMWAIFEASLQRHYIRKEAFRLRLGNDEWRLMAVGLVVGILFFVAYLVGAIAVALIAGLFASTQNEVIASIGAIGAFVLLFVILLLYAARISAASALTIRDERVRIFESIRITKGRSLRIMAALAIIWIILYIVQLIIYGSGAFAVLGQLSDTLSSDQPDVPKLIAELQAPAIAGTIAALMAALMFVYGIALVFLGGPGALAVLNDPDRPFDGNDPADVFA